MAARGQTTELTDVLTTPNAAEIRMLDADIPGGAKLGFKPGSLPDDVSDEIRETGAQVMIVIHCDPNDPVRATLQVPPSEQFYVEMVGRKVTSGQVDQLLGDPRSGVILSKTDNRLTLSPRGGCPDVDNSADAVVRVRTRKPEDDDEVTPALVIHFLGDKHWEDVAAQRLAGSGAEGMSSSIESASFGEERGSWGNGGSENRGGNLSKNKRNGVIISGNVGDVSTPERSGESRHGIGGGGSIVLVPAVTRVNNHLAFRFGLAADHATDVTVREKDSQRNPVDAQATSTTVGGLVGVDIVSGNNNPVDVVAAVDLLAAADIVGNESVNGMRESGKVNPAGEVRLSAGVRLFGWLRALFGVDIGGNTSGDTHIKTKGELGVEAKF